MTILMTFRDDVYNGEKGHPRCCFFEEFPSSNDPDESFFGLLACHMSSREEDAETCKGDYLLCPLAYGKSIIKPSKGGDAEPT
jgi:hypothetical protein